MQRVNENIKMIFAGGMAGIPVIKKIRRAQRGVLIYHKYQTNNNLGGITLQVLWHG